MDKIFPVSREVKNGQFWETLHATHHTNRLTQTHTHTHTHTPHRHTHHTLLTHSVTAAWGSVWAGPTATSSSGITSDTSMGDNSIGAAADSAVTAVAAVAASVPPLSSAVVASPSSSCANNNSTYLPKSGYVALRCTQYTTRRVSLAQPTQQWDSGYGAMGRVSRYPDIFSYIQNLKNLGGE